MMHSLCVFYTRYPIRRAISYQCLRYKTTNTIGNSNRLLVFRSKLKEDIQEFGFQFQCTKCGKCCTGKGGKVRINDHEIQAITKYLNINEVEMKEMYLEKINQENQWSLKQDEEKTKCIFLKDHKCTIYQVRPTQCRTYPWWPQNLISSYDWHMTARECEGINLSPINKSSDSNTAYSIDDVLPEAMVYDIHRSGEVYTYDESKELLEDVLEEDTTLQENYKTELFTKYNRHLIYHNETLTVMDSYLDENQSSRRCFFFNDRYHLIQSEVELYTCPIENRQIINRKHLCLDVHQAMAMAIVWLPQNLPLNIAVIGAGTCTLPLFLLEHVENIKQLDAIELSDDVIAIAQEYFGLREAEQKESLRLKLHSKAGETFFKEERLHKFSAYHAIVIDVEGGNIGRNDIQAPPESFLDLNLLSNINFLLVPNGIAIINVITSSEAAKKTVEQIFTQVFPGGIVLELPSNTIFYLFKDTNNVSIQADLNSLIESLHKDLQVNAFQKDHVRSLQLLDKETTRIRLLMNKN